MLGSGLSVVSGFHFGGRDVAAVLVEAAVVEPVDPFGGGQLDVVDTSPQEPSGRPTRGRCMDTCADATARDIWPHVV